MTNDATQCTSLIKSHFELVDEEIVLTTNDLVALEQKLTLLINHLLATDLNRLLNAFYRMDLKEEIFRDVIANVTPDQIGITLAKEVIKRELQKVATRNKYREG